MDKASLYRGINHNEFEVSQRDNSGVAFTINVSATKSQHPRTAKTIAFLFGTKKRAWITCISFFVLTWATFGVLLFFLLIAVIFYGGWVILKKQIGLLSPVTFNVDQSGVRYLNFNYTPDEWDGLTLGSVRDSDGTSVNVKIQGVTYHSGFSIKYNQEATADVINQANTLIREGLQIAKPIDGGGSLAADAANDGDWE